MSHRALPAIVIRSLTLVLVPTAVALLVSCAVRDEARRAGVAVGRLVPVTPTSSDVDYFRDMDYVLLENGQPPPPLSSAAIAGRNMWMLWTGGNDRLWDRLTIDSIGTFDLLKVISSPRRKNGYVQGYGRRNRFQYLGLVNEPCFTEARTLIRIATVCGWTFAIRSVRQTRLPTRQSIPA